MEHPISDLFKLSSASLKELTSVDTIIGKTVIMENGIFIVPISKIKCSFATGGVETMSAKADGKMPFGGATGGNVTITPIAFLVVNNEEVKLLHLEDQTHLLEKIIDDIPELVGSMKNLFSKKPKTETMEVVDKKIKL